MLPEFRYYSLKSAERIMKIRNILLNLNRPEYLPYNLVGGLLTLRLEDLYASVFVFFEEDKSLSIQVDDLGVLFRNELWDYMADLKTNNKTVNHLLEQDSLQGTSLQASVQTDLCGKNMPLAGLAFFGKDPSKPKNVVFFNHQSIPIGFSINGIKTLARSQKEKIRGMM